MRSLTTHFRIEPLDKSNLNYNHMIYIRLRTMFARFAANDAEVHVFAKKEKKKRKTLVKIVIAFLLNYTVRCCFMFSIWLYTATIIVGRTRVYGERFALDIVVSDRETRTVIEIVANNVF